MAEKVIFHCDCNNYFASVELLSRPELKNKAVAVSGNADSRHGIILAKNEIAKKYGVKTAETIWQAKQKCPELILLAPHREKYREYSDIINSIYGDYTDRVEKFGIDESWLDMTGSWQLFGESPESVAKQLKCRVKEKTGLTISVGVSYNKIFAKLGSDYKKPDAVTVIMKRDVESMIWPMSVSALLYVGSKVRDILEGVEIRTIGQLAMADTELIKQLLGKQGMSLQRSAQGLDTDEVRRIGEKEPVKSIGNGITFKRDLIGYQDVRTGVGYLADEVAVRLRSKGLYASSIQVLIKDTNLKSITRQKPLPYATNLAKDIVNHAMELIEKHWDLNKPIRMLTVTAQNISDIPLAVQLDIFGSATGPDKRREELEKSIDKINSKYGKNSIVDGSVLNNDIGLDYHLDSTNNQDSEE